MVRGYHLYKEIWKAAIDGVSFLAKERLVIPVTPSLVDHSSGWRLSIIDYKRISNRQAPPRRMGLVYETT